MAGRDFKGRNGSHFSQVLALLITEVKLLPAWNVPHFRSAPCTDSERRRRSFLLRNYPTNKLFRVEINRVGFHDWRSPEDGHVTCAGNRSLLARKMMLVKPSHSKCCPEGRWLS